MGILLYIVYTSVSHYVFFALLYYNIIMHKCFINKKLNQKKKKHDFFFYLFVNNLNMMTHKTVLQS